MLKSKEFTNFKRLEKVNHFLKEKNFQYIENYEVYFLKSINEKGKYITLEKIKKLIDSEKNFYLSLLPNQKTVNLNKIDSENIIEYSANEYYDLYLIKSKNEKYYLVIQENNIFEKRANFELAYFKKVSNFNDFIFINKQKIN